MKTNRNYWKYICGSIALLIGFSLTGCGGGGDSGTSSVPPTSTSSISTFSINGATGLVDQSTKAINITLPAGTAVTGLIATFSTSGSSVTVGGVPQVSGTTSNNFTSPVSYLVTAADGSTATYIVTVTVATTTSKAITNYVLGGVNGTINEVAKTIGVVMPSGTTVTGLIATFSTSGSSVTVGGVPQVSGTTSNNFTSPVSYLVTAADGSTATYIVTVTVAATSSKAITSYVLGGVTGSINEVAKTISVVMPSGTTVTGLIATFSTSGSSVKVGSTVQVSGTTSNNFTTPVSYVVTAADGSAATYVVTVTVAATSTKAISSYVLGGITGTINQVPTTKTISVTLPSGTAVTELVATFSTSGSSVAVAGTTQVSGTTSNDFTSPVSYVVTAADGSTATYVVTVTVAATSSKAITSYVLGGVTGTINEVPTTKTISVTLPSGTAVTSLIATFSTSGSSVTVSSTPQVSGTTSNDFTSPVSYIVTAANSSTATYLVTVTVAAAGPGPVALGDAGNYALFSNTGMSSTPDSAITGDVGVGPGVTSTAITTGFTKTVDSSGEFATAPQVTGRIYAFDYAAPTPIYVASSSADMGIAYDDARGRLNPDGVNLGGTNLAGLTLSPGLYKWDNSINLALSEAITLNGGPNDVWILQIAGGLTTGANSNVVLTGGALPENVFWQLDTALTVGANSTFQGVALAGTSVTLGNSSVVNGRLLAKTAITMDSNTITKPAN